MTTNRKCLKSESALFQTSSILFSFIQFVKCWRKFLESNPKGPYQISEKEKEKFLCFVQLLHKATSEIRKFHVAIVQKNVMRVQICRVLLPFQGRSHHIRTYARAYLKNLKIYIFKVYILVYFIYLFIGFWAKSDLYTCKSFPLYCCYFTKRKLCEYYTIHFNVHEFKTLSSQPHRNPRMAIQRPDLLTPWSHFLFFFWEVHKRIWPRDLTAAWNAAISGQNLWVHEVFKVLGSVKLFSSHLSGKWIKWPRYQWATSLTGLWLTRSIKRRQQKVYSIYLFEI